MKTRLFVASIPYATTELHLKEFFEQAGKVVYVKIIKNRETSLSRGFGFVEMASELEAKDALKLNGIALNKRKIIVKEAWESESFQRTKNEEQDHGS